MPDKDSVVHFDVDVFLENLLIGRVFPFSLSQKNLAKIPGKDKIEVLTINAYSKIDKNLLNFFPKLKLLLTRSVGTDHLDLFSCRKKKIKVINIPDYGSEIIAEHAMALLLSGCRQIVKADKFVRKGEFHYENFLGLALSGKTLGVIGTGKIGLAFIKIAKGFNLNILAYDIYKNQKAEKDLKFSYVSFEELIKKSDIISLHIPFSLETKHLINETVINQMKNDVILINTSRGGIIDTQALIKAIKKFRFVGLDVLEDEKNFNKNHPLLKFKNVLITPHIAFLTDKSIKNIAKITNETIKKFC